MKKFTFILFLLAGMMACKNQKQEFDDYLYTTGYFPYQYPVRTLVLGDYIYDNTNDNNHKFVISAAMGGVYENGRDRIVEFQLAAELCNRALFDPSKDTIRLLPQKYYTLGNPNKITIPGGKISGGVEVQLTDAFFDDTLSYRLAYVLPIKITKVQNLDSILVGKTTKTNPDVRVDASWDVLPRNFTMFAINFINPYHGNYLHRGTSTVKNSSSAVIETTGYRTQYIEDNEIWMLTTTGKNQVTLSANARTALMPGLMKMALNFDANGNITIASAKGSAFAITGSGKFVKEGDMWGNKKRDAIQISYQYVSGGNTYSATDTLVIRDRAVKMQLYKPLLY